MRVVRSFTAIILCIVMVASPALALGTESSSSVVNTSNQEIIFAYCENAGITYSDDINYVITDDYVSYINVLDDSSYERTFILCFDRDGLISTSQLASVLFDSGNSPQNSTYPINFPGFTVSVTQFTRDTTVHTQHTYIGHLE